MADPGFPRGGGANPEGGRQPIIWPIFPENCMKMKKFWARGGGRASLAPPLRSATGNPVSSSRSSESTDRNREIYFSLLDLESEHNATMRMFPFLIFSGQAEGIPIQSGTFNRETNVLRMETWTCRYEATLFGNSRKMEGRSTIKNSPLTKQFQANYVRWQ